MVNRIPSSIHMHLEGTIARVELWSADGYPRLTRALLGELDDQLDALLADSDCHGIVLHGSEKCFAAGAELAEVNALEGISALEFGRRGQLLFEKVAGAPKPVVAAITGHCLGGGFDPALACQARLAAPTATFGYPGATLGILTGWGGTQRLPRAIGRSQALELLLSGETVNAERALALGLVDAVVPGEKLLSRAVEHATLLVERGRSLK